MYSSSDCRLFFPFPFFFFASSRSFFCYQKYCKNILPFSLTKASFKVFLLYFVEFIFAKVVADINWEVDKAKMDQKNHNKVVHNPMAMVADIPRNRSSVDRGFDREEEVIYFTNLAFERVFYTSVILDSHHRFH
jgi:hypothetical protein